MVAASYACNDAEESKECDAGTLLDAAACLVGKPGLAPPRIDIVASMPALAAAAAAAASHLAASAAELKSDVPPPCLNYASSMPGQRDGGVRAALVRRPASFLTQSGQSAPSPASVPTSPLRAAAVPAAMREGSFTHRPSRFSASRGRAASFSRRVQPDVLPNVGEDVSGMLSYL